MLAISLKKLNSDSEHNNKYLNTEKINAKESFQCNIH